MTLKTLAQSLGLSITTVSRALDGYADVAPGTRERVRAAADAMGYRPNAAARRLRRGTTEVVMLVLPTLPGRFECRPQPGPAGADDDDIERMIGYWICGHF